MSRHRHNLAHREDHSTIADGITLSIDAAATSSGPSCLSRLPARRRAAADSLQPLKLFRDQGPSSTGYYPPCDFAEKTVEQIDS